MIFTNRPIGAVLFVFIPLMSLLIGPQSTRAADDMWGSVFAYQRKMADYGNAEAQYQLGEMYEEGHGTAQNFDKALEWYRKSAAQGYAPAGKKIEQVLLRKQRAIAEANAEEKRRTEQSRRETAEQQMAEAERMAREKAMQQDEEKQHQAKGEVLARKRAEAAIKAMMAIPSAFPEE